MSSVLAAVKSCVVHANFTAKTPSAVAIIAFANGSLNARHRSRSVPVAVDASSSFTLLTFFPRIIGSEMVEMMAANMTADPRYAPTVAPTNIPVVVNNSVISDVCRSRAYAAMIAPTTATLTMSGVLAAFSIYLCVVSSLVFVHVICKS